MLRGAKGESIEEADDLDKELALLKQRLNNSEANTEFSKSNRRLLNLFECSITPLSIRFIEVCKKFEDFYLNAEFSFFWGGNTIHISKDESILNAKSKILNWDDVDNARLEYQYNGFKENNFINVFTFISFNFDAWKYQISVSASDSPIYEKYYDVQLSEDEIERIVSATAKAHKEMIESFLDN
jgi:hypothetical protein